jgi:site-specific recombinase XerD
MTPLAPLITRFFRHHLAVEKGASQHTIASYSYAFKFLCRYVSKRLGKAPSALALEDLDAHMIRDHLAHLESDYRNTPRTRNLRLTAIRSFMKYVEYEVPSALEQTRQVLAVSNKRTVERLINHLTREEMKAVLDAPNPNTRTGLRDQAMLYLGFAAGLRASELVGLRLDEIELEGPYPSILVRGKGPKPASASAVEGSHAGTEGLAGRPGCRPYTRSLLECARRSPGDLRVHLHREEACPRGRPTMSEPVEKEHRSACASPHLCDD